MNIALSFNQNYLTPAYVLLTSIFQNNKRKMCFHLIAEGLSEPQKADLETFILNNGSEVRFHYVERIDGLPVPKNSYFSIETYYRWFFPHLIEGDKFLFLDVDMVVIKDLWDVYRTNMEGYAVAAVQDSYFEARTDLWLESTEQYFNAGVLLVDIQLWKEQQLTEKALNFTQVHQIKMRFVDQDALNAVLKGNWYRLDKRYNLTRGDVLLQVPTKKIVQEAAIVHYTTGEKPWLSLSRNKLRFLYHDYLELSPVDERKYTDFKLRKLVSFFRIRLKEAYFNYRINRILPIPAWNKIKHDY